MSEHLPGCRFVITRVGGWETGDWRCAPECPVHRRLFSPAANAAAAMRLYEQAGAPRMWAVWKGVEDG